MVAGPKLVKRALGKELSKEELGGVGVHGGSGVADNIAVNEDDAMKQVRSFLSYLPRSVEHRAPRGDVIDPPSRVSMKLDSIIPKDRKRPYKMASIIASVLDTDSFFEIGSGYGKGVITGLARLHGYPVGVMANDCMFNAGSMSATGAQKVMKLINLCETFKIPILNIVDEPGFMIGLEAEQAATIRHGTNAAVAAASSTVPWATVVVRKMFGVAATVHLGPESLLLIWPTAELGPLPVEGGVEVAFGRQIAASPDPEGMRRQLEEQLAKRFDPFVIAENFSTHEMIRPCETRASLCDWIGLATEAAG